MRPYFLVKLQRERQLGIVLRGIAAQAGRAQRPSYIYRAVGIVEREVVVFVPLLVFRKHVQPRLSPLAAAAVAFQHGHRQTGIGHCHGVGAAVGAVAHGVGHGLGEVLLAFAAGLLRSIHCHRHAGRHAEGGLELEVIQVGNAAGDAVGTYGQLLGLHHGGTRGTAVPHELGAEYLARVVSHRECECRDGRSLGHRHVGGIVGKRQWEGVAGVGGKVGQCRASELGTVAARQDGNPYLVALTYIGGAGDVARVTRSVGQGGRVAPVHRQRVRSVGSPGPGDFPRCGIKCELASKPAAFGQGQDDAFQVVALKGGAGGIDVEPKQREQVAEGEPVGFSIGRSERRRTHLVVAFYPASAHVVGLRQLQVSLDGRHAGRGIVLAVRIVGVGRLFALLQVSGEYGFGHSSGVGRCERRVARTVLPIHADAVARHP